MRKANTICRALLWSSMVAILTGGCSSTEEPKETKPTPPLQRQTDCHCTERSEVIGKLKQSGFNLDFRPGPCGDLFENYVGESEWGSVGVEMDAHTCKTRSVTLYCYFETLNPTKNEIAPVFKFLAVFDPKAAAYYSTRFEHWISDEAYWYDLDRYIDTINGITYRLDHSLFDCRKSLKDGHIFQTGDKQKYIHVEVAYQ
jgi:hypothetical protein